MRLFGGGMDEIDNEAMRADGFDDPVKWISSKKESPCHNKNCSVAIANVPSL